MTLYELVNDTAVQGNVRISTWEGNEEKVLLEVSNTDDLTTGDLNEEYEDREVLYMFCSHNILHIELDSED